MRNHPAELVRACLALGVLAGRRSVVGVDVNRRGGLVVHAPRLRRRLDLGLGLLVVVAEARVFDVLGGDATRATRGALLRGNLLRGRSLALLVAGASRTLGGVGGRGVDGASDLGGDSMVRPGRGTAQVRGVLHDERFEGELRGKIHPTRHLELFKVRLVEAEPIEVYHEHPGQPHDAANVRRGRAVAPVLLAIFLHRLGGEKPAEQRRELDVSAVAGTLRERDGDVLEGLVTDALGPALLARRRPDDLGGEVRARGA